MYTRFWRRGSGVRVVQAPQTAGAAQHLAAAPAGAEEHSRELPALPEPVDDSPPSGPRLSSPGSSRDSYGAALAAEDVGAQEPRSVGTLGLGEGATEDGLPVFPLLPREELATPEELAIRFQGYGQCGCKHYYRRARLFPGCCNSQEPVWCRHCHDEQQAALGGGSSSLRREVLVRVHDMDRRRVDRVQCALCHTVQPFASECMACGTVFGRYTCLECRFFDDDIRKEQWHCDKCGICRAGGKSNFFHCDTCGCCYSRSMLDSHTCRENSIHSDCPVCCEFLFHSVLPVTVMACGHAMHEHCLRNLMNHNQFTCPLCARSVCDMSAVWASRDAQVAATAMPEEYTQLRVTAACNDCGAKGEVAFHVLGLKCSGAECGSYNTRRC